MELVVLDLREVLLAVEPGRHVQVEQLSLRVRLLAVLLYLAVIVVEYLAYLTNTVTHGP